MRGVWGLKPWHPPMLAPCEGGAGFAIDDCRTLQSIVHFVGHETWRIVWEAMETCPICGHVRAARTPAVSSRKQHRCTHCHRADHNRATCPDLPKKPPRDKDPSTKSWQASEWLRTNGGTLFDAAARFGVTRQAVQQMWKARGIGDLPRTQKRAEVVAQLAQCDGMTSNAIQAKLGVDRQTIRRLAPRAKVSVAPKPKIVDRIRPDVEKLAPLIVTREITITELAIRLGVTHAVVDEALKGLIDRPRALHNRGKDYRGRVDGKSKAQRASELVEQGVSVRHASAQIGVSARCVYKYRRVMAARAKQATHHEQT